MRWTLVVTLATTAGVFAYVLWTLFHSSGSKKRKNHTKRHHFNNEQKKTIYQAQLLWQQGNIQGAINLFESINMHIEAASLLEQNGMTLEAGQLLSRSGHKLRAAQIFEKYEHWPQATQSYRELGDYLKEGLCAQHAGFYADAALAYSSGQAHHEAGICYMHAQQPAQAAAAFILAGEHQHWLAALQHIAEHTPDQYQISRLEVSWFMQLGDQLHQYPKILDLLDKQDILVPLILNRLEQKDLENASIMFETHRHRKNDLISRIDYESPAAETLSRVLLWSGEYESAGILFQQRSEYDKAASAFKQAGNIKRYEECQRLAQGFSSSPDGQGFSLSSLDDKVRSQNIAPDKAQEDQTQNIPQDEETKAPAEEPPDTDETVVIQLDLENSK